MAKKVTGALDDSLSDVKITDFSGGLNTMEGALSLSASETPDCQNVLGFPGRLLYVGGTTLDVTLPARYQGDGGEQFYDANNNKHLIGWANGNMYDLVNGILLLIRALVYTPGQNIGHSVLNSALYWCTATVPMRCYDGITEYPVVSSGATGAVAIPAGTCMCTYAGSLIIGNPNIAGVLNNGAIIPSNVNDPTTFLGANETTLGNSNVIQALIPMSVEAGGIPPTSSVMCVGEVGLVLAQGSTNAFKLQNVNYPIGCVDGNSAVYIPTGDILGNVVFLGTDNQFHESNGITTKIISSKILNLMNALVSNALVTNPLQRFFATYNKRYHYYLCDMGNDVQMLYKWTMMSDGSTKAGFFKVSGWPSGAYFSGTGGAGLPTNYVIANGTDTAGLYEVGIDNANFNGVQPAIYYNTPYLHANDVSIMKEWQWVNLTFNNQTPVDYVLNSTGLTNAANVTPVGNPIVFQAPQNQGVGGASVWNQSIWNVNVWGNIPTLPTQGLAINSKMLSATATDALGNIVNMPLRSSAITVNIAWQAGNPNSVASFDITNLGLRYKGMGHYMTGGAVGSAEAA